MYNVQIFPGVKATNDLCLWMEERGTLAIADLHIGLEAALEQTGVHIPRIQSASMKESLIRIMDRYEPDTILILGDLKHEFSGNLDQEWRDVRDILSMLRDSATVKVAKGNHDNYLANISQRLGIEVADSFELDGISFMHGHAPSDHRPLVIGHEHPSVRIFDRVGSVPETAQLPSFRARADPRPASVLALGIRYGLHQPGPGGHHVPGPGESGHRGRQGLFLHRDRTARAGHHPGPGPDPEILRRCLISGRPAAISPAERPER